MFSLPVSCSAANAYPSTGYLLACVGSRIHYIVLYVYGLAVGCLYHCHRMVSVKILRGSGAGHRLIVGRSVDCFGVHCHESCHSVAPVYVEQLTCRTETVGGIYIAAMVAVVVETPVVPVIGPELLKVVYVAAFCVQHFAE